MHRMPAGSVRVVRGSLRRGDGSGRSATAPSPGQRRGISARVGRATCVVASLLLVLTTLVIGVTASAPAASADPVITEASISSGSTQTCGVTSAGAAMCWGNNAYGQLGNNTTTPSNVPVQVAGLTSGVTAISTGNATSCAVVSGAAKCWGHNGAGELGNNSTTPSLVPVQVSGLTSGVTTISVGLGHACALVSGAAMCWGYNSSGQVGNSSTTDSWVPVQVSGLASGVTAISAGALNSCAVASGAATCWGYNGNGGLGDNSTTRSLVPVQVSGLASEVTAISAGYLHSCAVVSGAATCWGNNGNGRLGNNSTTQSLVPVQVSGLTSGVTAISAGDTHTCGVVSGSAQCWGNNGNGRLGNNSTTRSLVPVQVSGLTSGVTAISAGQGISFGQAHSCAVVSGDATCWGYNSDGRLGNNSTTQSLVPVPVSGGHTFGFVNTAPVAAAQSVTAPRGVATHVVLGATEVDPDVLAFSVVDEPTKGEVVCDGAFGEDCTYTAGPGQIGADSFTFKANDGTDDSNIATVSITITNQAPIADAVAASAPRGVATEIVLTGSDPNSDPFTFTKASDPTKGSVSCTSGGICTYTADPGTFGTDTFTHTTSDGSLTSAAGTVTVTITNQAPVADPRSLDAGRGVATPVVLSGSDLNGDDLEFSIVDAPGKGTVDCNPTDSSDCTYNSTPSSTGTDSFTYKANDGDLDSAPVTVSITLVNAGPTANDQAVSAPRGVATDIVLAGADGEGDELDFTVVDQPTKGSLDCTGAGLADCTYTAAAGETGTDTFTFTASDGFDTSAIGTVTVTITNQAPVANAQTVAGNAPTTATPITVTGSDPNGDALTYAKATDPTKGDVTCTGDSCTYTATAGRTGTDSFTFTVTDISGLESTATVTVNLDNATPGVFVGATDYLEPEAGNATYEAPFIPVTLTTPAAAPVTVWYYTVDGTAVTTGLGGDYRQWGTPASPRSITIPAGQTTGWIQPPVFDDDQIEGPEDFDVVISSLTGGASYLGDGTTTVNIVDADTVSAGKPILSVADIDQGEGNVGTRVIGFRVQLSKAAATPVTVTCTKVAGTAVAGTDYKVGDKTVTIPAGKRSVTVDTLVYTNTTAQADRSFTLNCTVAGTPDITVHRNSATATLHDED